MWSMSGMTEKMTPIVMPGRDLTPNSLARSRPVRKWNAMFMAYCDARCWSLLFICFRLKMHGCYVKLILGQSANDIESSI